MKSIVSTHSALYFLDASYDGELLRCEVLSDGYHYGIWAEGETSFWAYRGGEDVHSQNDRTLDHYSFDGRWNKDRSVPMPDDVDALHQVVLTAPDECVIANTLFNEVAKFSLATEEIVDRHRFDDTNVDRNHINSIVQVGGYLVVMLHNFRRQESELCLLEMGSLLEVSRLSLPDVQCHNIGFLDGRVYYNGSGRRRLSTLDLNTGRHAGSLPFPEHPKGLASDGERIYVGSSNYASRSERGRSSGWLTAVDPGTLKAIWTVQLETEERGHAVGNVNEIRLLSPNDEFAKATDIDQSEILRFFGGGMPGVEVWSRRASIVAVDSAKRLVKRFKDG